MSDSARTFQTRMIKNFPEHAVVDAGGAELARAHCVNVPANLFTLIIGGRWSGVAPEATVVAKMKAML